MARAAIAVVAAGAAGEVATRIAWSPTSAVCMEDRAGAIHGPRCLTFTYREVLFEE